MPLSRAIAKRKQRIFALVLAIAGSVAVAVPAQVVAKENTTSAPGRPVAELKEILFGYNPAENNESAELSAKKFSDYFRGKIGVPVRTFVSTDYMGLVEALRSKRLDFAWMPPFSFVKAEKIADAIPLMKSVYRGQSEIYSALIVLRSRGFTKIADLKGKNVAWVDPSSATGHIFPKATLIRRHGLDPDKFFGRQIFAGGHDAVVLAVSNGTVDAGATYMANAAGQDGAWEQFLKTPEEKARIQILMTSEPIASDLIATSKGFREKYPEVVAKMTEILEAMGRDPEGAKLLKELYKVDRLVPAKSEDYEPVREAARLLKIQ